MFGLFTRDRKDPADIARDYAKENEIELKDENPTQEGSDSSTDDKAVDSKKDDIEDDKPSQDEEGTQKDAGQDEDKDDQLSEEDQKLIDTDDAELDDGAKDKKKEIQDRKDAKKNTGAEKRIAELNSKLKAMEADAKERDTKYQQRLDIFEAEKTALQERIEEPLREDPKTALVQMEKERIDKYMSEDSGLPKEERREMSKEEIDEWLVEDYQEANDWLYRRHDRRKTERSNDIHQTQVKVQAEDIIRKQNLSKIRVEARHPELKTESIIERKEALKGEGKSETEIQTILCDEIPKYKVMKDIMTDKNFLSEISISPDGPERLEKEMMKRLEGKPSGQSGLEKRIAELEDQLKAKELRKEPVGAGVGSRPKGGDNMRNDEKHNPALDAELKKMAKVGYKMTAKEHEEAVERRKSIPGANEYEPDR